MKKVHKRRRLEIPSNIFFDPRQKTLYGLQVKPKRRIPGCIYPLWHLLRGRGRYGEFPLMVVREYLIKRHYKVLCSSSVRKTSESFICASYPGLRREKPLHPAYQRMAQVFGFERLNKFNAIAEEEKRKHGRNRGGGDPDMFVYKGNGRRVRFFVEVKHKDKPHTNQKIVFHLIRKHLGCPVYLIHIHPKKAQS
jgi:hypothetical protein